MPSRPRADVGQVKEQDIEAKKEKKIIWRNMKLRSMNMRAGWGMVGFN